MTSFAPDPEDPTSKPIRAGTFPHKKQNNINTEESFPLIPSSGIHHSTSSNPRSSGFKPGLLPSKKSGHDFSQHPFTSNSASSSQNSGLSDLHPSGNSIPQVPFAEEETQLLQNPERGRKASYNVPNNIPLEPLQLSSFSNIPQAGVFTNGNGKFYFHLLMLQLWVSSSTYQCWLVLQCLNRLWIVCPGSPTHPCGSIGCILLIHALIHRRALSSTKVLSAILPLANSCATVMCCDCCRVKFKVHLHWTRSEGCHS